MTINFAKPFVHARTVLCTTAKLSDDANAVFLSWARQLEELFLDSAARVSNRAIAVIPAVTSQLSDSINDLGERMQRPARDTTSVVVESVPPALFRTAACLVWLGDWSSSHAQRLAHALVPSAHSVQERVDDRLRHMGRSVSALAGQGLDAVLVGRALRAQLNEVYDLKAEHRITTRGGCK